MKLSNCPVGQKVELVSIENEDLSLQLYNMGCLPGETISIERIALLGDPLIILFNHTFVSIRKADTDLIMVREK
jgi:ferrous iron transport protein A